LVAVAHNALVTVKPRAATTNSTRVDNSRDMIPHIGTITTSAIRYAVCTQTISSALADSPPWIWLSELVTICTSIMAMNRPMPIARTPIQSRRPGSGPAALASGRARATGSAGASPADSRTATWERASRPRRSVSASVIAEPLRRVAPAPYRPRG
jgi:hypothetical protein